MRITQIIVVKFNDDKKIHLRRLIPAFFYFVKICFKKGGDKIESSILYYWKTIRDSFLCQKVI